MHYNNNIITGKRQLVPVEPGQLQVIHDIEIKQVKLFMFEVIAIVNSTIILQALP